MLSYINYVNFKNAKYTIKISAIMVILLIQIHAGFNKKEWGAAQRFSS